VTMLGDSAINLAVKPWVAVDQFLSAQVELYQAIVGTFSGRPGADPLPAT